MNKTVVAIVVIVLIALGLGLSSLQTMPEQNNYVQDASLEVEDVVNNEVTNQMPASDNTNVEEMIVEESSVKEFVISGKNFAFTPNSMSVRKGDTVRVIFKNTDGFHDFKIDEFGVATKQIQGGSQEVVEFVADKVGSFEYYCSVGAHRKNGMWGTLTVLE